jgi:hypothetical protein
MSAFLVEEEAGTCSGRLHPHNGYYAGDFGLADLSTAWHATFAVIVETTAHPAETGRR